MGSVSIVLPAYNAMPFLGEALQSVLNQTLQDFEFIIIDDASSDTTASEIARFAEMDSRIVFLANEKRRGVAESLNLGIEAANGTWIARMDADDVAHPRRLERQISYLEANPELILLGTNVGLIDAQGRQLAHRLRMPTSHEDIDALLIGRRLSMIHPTVVIKREAIKKVGGYRPEFPVSEDHDIFLRLAEVGRMANLDEVLLHYRLHTSAQYDSPNHARFPEIIAQTLRRRGLSAPPVLTHRQRRLGLNLRTGYLVRGMLRRLSRGEVGAATELASLARHLVRKHLARLRLLWNERRAPS